MYCEGGPGKERREELTALPYTCHRRRVHPRKGVAQSTGGRLAGSHLMPWEKLEGPHYPGHLRGVPPWPALSAWPHPHNQGYHECFLSGVQMWAQEGAAHSFLKSSRAPNPNRRPQACPSGPALGTQGSSLNKPCRLVHIPQCASPTAIPSLDGACGGRGAQRSCRLGFSASQPSLPSRSPREHLILGSHPDQLNQTPRVGPKCCFFLITDDAINFVDLTV